MTVEDIEKAAIQGVKLKYMTAPQKNLYRQFISLYTLYRMGRLTRDQASAEKKDILADYHALEEKYAVLSEYQDNIRCAGTLLSDIEKADSADDKLRLALECIGCMVGDVDFARRSLKGVNQND